MSAAAQPPAAEGGRPHAKHGAALFVRLAVFALLALAACGALVAWLDPALRHGMATVPPLSPLRLAVANALPAALVALLLLAVSRRPVFALWTTLLLFGALYAVSALKSKLLATPLLPIDFMLAVHPGDGGTLLSRYVPMAARIAAAAGVAGCILLLWRERAWATLRGASRAALLFVVLAALGTLMLGTRPWSDLYPGDEAHFHPWSPKETVRMAGLAGSLLRFEWRMHTDLPAPDEAAARALMRAHPDAVLPNPGSTDAALPDIVVLQSESFFDPALLRGLGPDQVLPQYRRLAATSRHGDMWVPTYGGGTIRTEFEVLTGMAMRSFPTVEFPYFRLTSHAIPSLASVLAARGYRTLAVHPHERDFWNRATALAHLGFRQFDAIEQFAGARPAGFFVSDEALVDHILRRLDEPRPGPMFVFAISMENHGPYDAYPDADETRRAAEPVPAGLDDAAARDLRGYLWHLENADRSLGRLADALRARPRRTLLLFYGDHLPALPAAYAQAGFRDAAEPDQHAVPWLLLDTAQARPEAATQTAGFYLPAMLLDAAGVDDRGYFRVLESVRRGDSPARGWTPREESGLRAIMQMRQRGTFERLLARPAPAARRQAA